MVGGDTPALVGFMVYREAMVVGSCFVDIALFLDGAGRVSSVSRYSRASSEGAARLDN